MRLVTALLALSLALANTAGAETKMMDGAKNIPQVDDTIETAGLVQLRESSPDPAFGVKGAQKGWLKAGELLKVLSVKNYISVYGTEIWLEVHRKDDARVNGWIFAGLAKEIARGKSVVMLHRDPEVQAQMDAQAAAARAAAEAMARTDALIRDEGGLE